MAERVDVLVVGAGPAGCTAARSAAEAGVSVLVVERQSSIGHPVQCAEYVPAQIVRYVSLPERAIAQRIQTLRTYLPDGSEIETAAPGRVLDRATFDKALAVDAYRAGVRLWTGARAVARTRRGVQIRRGRTEREIECRVIIGADGPRSTVSQWIGQQTNAYIDARQVEIVLTEPQPSTHVYFDPRYVGGYGWCFPKGRTATVGVGVNKRMGGDPRQALEHLLDRLQIRRDAIVGRTGGLVPSGGEVAQIGVDNVLLAGDAAGHTHPITGAGIATAVIGGTLAGKAAAQAVHSGDLADLKAYEHEWAAFMRRPLHHGLSKRQRLDQNWTEDPDELAALLRETWIAFKGYGRRAGQRSADER
jgi:geranylgeranyl reductase family protein